jgi:hypothetical protein
MTHFAQATGLAVLAAILASCSSPPPSPPPITEPLPAAPVPPFSEQKGFE